MIVSCPGIVRYHGSPPLAATGRAGAAGRRPVDRGRLFGFRFPLIAMERGTIPTLFASYG
jgi:hypothetical protein